MHAARNLGPQMLSAAAVWASRRLDRGPGALVAIQGALQVCAWAEAGEQSVTDRRDQAVGADLEQPRSATHARRTGANARSESRRAGTEAARASRLRRSLRLSPSPIPRTRVGLHLHLEASRSPRAARCWLRARRPEAEHGRLPTQPAERQLAAVPEPKRRVGSAVARAHRRAKRAPRHLSPGLQLLVEHLRELPRVSPLALPSRHAVRTDEHGCRRRLGRERARPLRPRPRSGAALRGRRAWPPPRLPIRRDRARRRPRGQRPLSSSQAPPRSPAPHPPSGRQRSGRACSWARPPGPQAGRPGVVVADDLDLPLRPVAEQREERPMQG